jgi:putative membrane-bound dehydrogenase-like protein
MTQRLSVFALLAVVATAAAAADPANEPAQPFAPPPITVPAGFVVELVAGPPLVQHPTMAGFDDEGRLYVCDGPGLNLPAKELLRDLPNLIRRLEDTDGDGRFDKSTVFADKMTFPMGALWHRGAVYTASPPNIWRLEDTNGDGVADQRKVLVSEFGFTGNAADIHGCFLGPDGRLYWCDGRHGHNFVDEQGNQISKGLAARVFSCKLDGSDVESFAGGGMDNPVEVTFTDEGELLGTVAIYDVIDGRHDALTHWVYGGAYPRYEQPCVKEFKRTGELLPPVSRFGQVAPSGVMRYRGTQLGLGYQNNIFLAQFNTHTVVRTQIERDGATFRSKDEDFLTSTSQDFHPTDVLEDADGSLLVIDTGGWFRIGCPLSKLAKPEILGGIYRIRRADGKPVQDPRGLALDWSAKVATSDLTARLADDRPAVRDRAMSALVVRGEAAVGELKKVVHSSAKSQASGLAVWALGQLNTAASRAAVRMALADSDASVRQIAARSAGTNRDAEALDELCELVVSDQPPIRRDAATALGRIRDKAAVKALVESLRTANDRFLEHSLIYALIQINDRAGTLAALKDSSPVIRRAALIALDQMNDSQLTREQVTPLLDTDDLALQKATLEVIERHEGWSAETVSLLGTWLSDPQLSAERSVMVRGALLAFSREAKVQKLVADTLASPTTPPAARLLALEVIARCDLSELPAEWLGQLSKQFASRDPQVLRQLVATVAARGGDHFDPQLLTLARNSSAPTDLRISAIAVLAKHGASLSPEMFALLASQLPENVAPIDRLAAAEALGSAKLDAAQLTELVNRLSAAGPLEFPALVRAFEKGQDLKVGLALVTALGKSPGLENLTAERLKQILADYPSDVQVAAEPLVKRLSANVEEQRARLEQLATLLQGGDPARGKAVYLSKKASCSACHRVGNEGAFLGPELTKIAQIRSRIDLLESVVFPSATFARGYESYAVVTDSGQIYTGILSRETADAVYLRTAQREEIRIGRKSIEQMAPSKLSIMPQGFDKLLTPDELRDLFAFLQTLR